MQKLLRLNHVKKGYIAIIVCAFVPIIITATKLCLTKSDVESRTIREKFKFIELFVAGVTEGTGIAEININDCTENALLNVSKKNPDYTAPENGTGTTAITVNSPAYIVLTVQSTIEAKGSVTFSRGVGAYDVVGADMGWNMTTKIVDTTKHNIDKSQEFYFDFGHFDPFASSPEKLCFQLENVKIDSAYLDFHLMGVTISSLQSSSNNKVEVGDLCVEGYQQLSAGKDLIIRYAGYENWSGHIAFQYVSGKLTAYGSTIDDISFDSSKQGARFEIQIPTANNEVLLRLSGEAVLSSGILFYDNYKTLTINHGIKIKYDDSDKTVGKFLFSGSGNLRVAVSPILHNSYIYYSAPKIEKKQHHVIESGAVQTVVISPSTHKYEKQSDGTYKVQLDLQNVKILKVECPQVYVAQ